MVSAQRQFPGDVFAGRSGVEGEFEVACLADEKAVGGQDGTIGIGDSDAEFAGAILRASQRGGEQEQECGVDQGGVDRNTAQIDSPRAAGNASEIFYSDDGRRLLDGSATTFGREGTCCSDMSSLLECCPFGLGHSEVVIVLEMRPSCARLGQPGGGLSLRSLWTGVPTYPSPHNLGALRSGDGGHDFL
jgi:hypothetical protein